jgi:hypothetical protein
VSYYILNDDGGKEMKRFLILLVILVFAAPFAFAEELELLKKDDKVKTVKIDSSWLENRAKLGLALGTPWGATFGYHFSEKFEGNFLIGSTFKVDGVTLGGSGLFTLVNLDISGEIFPLSAGPAAYVHFADPLGVDLLGVVRLEYTFDIPLNLYLEGGGGVEILDEVGFAYTIAVAARYVF